ncbi:MAG: hypothetical protein ACYDBB_06445 [Armatimonadota bacterium]
MTTYYAITRGGGHWKTVCSGRDPEEVYRQAVDLLQGMNSYGDEEYGLLSPINERQIDLLRVVSEAVARETYHMQLSRQPVEE